MEHVCGAGRPYLQPLSRLCRDAACSQRTGCNLNMICALHLWLLLSTAQILAAPLQGGEAAVKCLDYMDGCTELYKLHNCPQGCIQWHDWQPMRDLQRVPIGLVIERLKGRFDSCCMPTVKTS